MTVSNTCVGVIMEEMPSGWNAAVSRFPNADNGETDDEHE